MLLAGVVDDDSNVAVRLLAIDEEGDLFPDWVKRSCAESLLGMHTYVMVVAFKECALPAMTVLLLADVGPRG